MFEVVFYAVFVGMAVVWVAFAASLIPNRRTMTTAGFRSVSPPRTEIDHVFARDGSLSVTGSARIGRWGVSFPFVTLTADADFVHVEGGVGEAWMRRREVASVVTLRRWPYGQMIRFVTASGDLDGVLFMTSDRPGTGEAVEGLRSLGWPVEDRT